MYGLTLLSVVKILLIIMCLIGDISAYNCFTNRLPITIGDTTGTTHVTAVLYSNVYYVAGHSTSTAIKAGGS